MKLQGIEAARGVAALLVVMVHATSIMAGPKDYRHEAFNGLLHFGRAGVDFFFVLSGFIITYAHRNDLSRPAVFGRFWRKRTLRIYPTYWAAFALWGLLLAISPTPSRNERDVWYVVASAILLPESGRPPILGVAWSLQHEMIFYAIFSTAIINKRFGTAVLAIWFSLITFNLCWAIAIGTPYFSGVWDEAVFRVFNIQFLFGIVIALLFQRGPAARPRMLALSGVLLFFANGVFESFGPLIQHEWPPRHLIYALASAMAIYGLATLDRARSLRVPTLMLELGASSYSIYLIHIIGLLLIQQATRYIRPIFDLPLELAYIAAVSFATLLGIVFSHTIERPLVRLGERFFAPKTKIHAIESSAG